MGRLKQVVAETADYLIVLVSRDTRWHFYVHFFGAKKRTKEASTSSKPPPIWGGLTAPPVAHSLR